MYGGKDTVIYGLMDGWMDGFMDSWMDEWMNGYMEAWMEIPADRQTAHTILRCQESIKNRKMFKK